MTGLRTLRPHQITSLDGLKQSISETWLPVVGYEGSYEVSDHGSIRSLDRVVSQLNRWGTITDRRLSGALLAQTPDLGKYSYGRLTVKLCKGNVCKTRLVHHLVLEAFIGPRPAGHESAHGDGNSANNNLSNLRYATPLDNTHDKNIHGTMLRGERAPNAKLTEHDVAKIRAARSGGRRLEDVAAEFGISIAQVSRIHNRKRWSHVAEAQP